MTTVLTHAAAAPAQYRLAESDRQKILSQSPLAKRKGKIEQMRKAFIERYGSDGLALND